MFSTEFLNKLRAYEIESYLPYLDKKQPLLELGGGTGEQARQLSERGYNVTSVDLEHSTYSEDRVFPVQDYDGEHLPFEDNWFGIIFSSNVMEHIPHLDRFHSELKRVLKDDGYCIHVMPSGSWRLWTSIVLQHAFSCYDGVNRGIEERIMGSGKYELCQQMTRKLFVAR